MSRLIDADTLKQECMYIYDIPVVTERDIDNAHTIYAIPVEWLKGLMLSTDDDVDKVEFEWIIREWQKEQEAKA